jgi:hypothetical protein
MRHNISMDLFNDLLETTTYSKSTHEEIELTEIYSPNQNTKLKNLSEDELISILSFLEMSDVLNFAFTSKAFRSPSSLKN